ncbi:MAG: sigma-70 family RNA polymerase sigma factor [Balneolia bacterium]|nr:sigma-70 family RNA polymerase sigma factor [Balneolia bacterium]
MWRLYMTDASQRDSEFELIRAILAGEGSSYRVLVERYSAMVFHIVRRFEKDESEAEELAQQIFIKAYENLQKFDMKAVFSTWLYRLAMNHCRDYAKNIRRGNKRFSELEPEFIERSLIDERTPYSGIELREWQHHLDTALECLNKEYADVFLWKYRDGLSYEVISEQTGISISALKVRVHRARKELKQRLDKKVS